MGSIRVWTIGHSTRTQKGLIETLKKYGIKLLVDVRHFPMSRHNPQFDREKLEKALPRRGIKYIWLEELGGFRTGGYQAYMKTKAYKEGIRRLAELASERPTAFMCAELLFFKCHRRYISDSLAKKKLALRSKGRKVACKFKVIHIFDAEKSQEHRFRERLRTIRCD